jgi:hypothetical protein
MIRSGKRGIKARSDLTNFRELLGDRTEKRAAGYLHMFAIV